MQNLLRFLATYYHFFIFLVLELISLAALVRFNSHQESVFFTSTSEVQGRIFQTRSNVTQYFNLRDQNAKLVEENIRLRAMDSINNFMHFTSDSLVVKDTSGEAVYSYQTAEVISNSIKKRKNYFTVNRGEKEGIEKGMGVISPNGIVGKIVKVGNHFSLAMSVLHEDFVVTPKIDDLVVYGGMRWLGSDPSKLNIQKVNAHYDIAEGDSVYTTSFSPFFPENILIGKVSRVEKLEGSNYQEIEVSLSSDIGQTREVYIVRNAFAQELDSLVIREEDGF